MDKSSLNNSTTCSKKVMDSRPRLPEELSVFDGMASKGAVLQVQVPCGDVTTSGSICSDMYQVSSFPSNFAPDCCILDKGSAARCDSDEASTTASEAKGDISQATGQATAAHQESAGSTAAKMVDAEQLKAEIRRTFDLVEPISKEAAAIFYPTLWEVDPTTKPLFQDTDMDSQGKKLMKTLGVAVSMLDDMEKLVPVLQKLGRRHVAYGVTADMYSSVTQALLITLDKGLGDECTAETKAAWGWILDVASKVCIDAAKELEPSYGDQTIQTERELERMEATGTKESAAGTPDVDAYKVEVRRTFDLVEPISQQAAAIFYPTLWEVDPTTKPLFKHTNMKSQGKKLMETLGVAVSMLDDMEKLVPVLQKLGRRHVAYGVTADMYSSVAQALLITLDKGLGDECTAETKAAWGWILDVASKVCIDAAKELEPSYGDQTIQTTRELERMEATGTKESAAGTPDVDAYKVEVRRTFDLVEPISQQAAAIFYPTLWEVDPTTKDTDMDSQGKKLMKTLGVAVSMLDDMEKLVPVLQKLGRRHVAYGVTADMYSSVAQALLITLDKGLGDECTAETKAAWGWILDVASKVCIDAAKELEPSYGDQTIQTARELERMEATGTKESAAGTPDVDAYKVEVRRTFDLVEPISQQAAAIFYPTLWEVDPTTKPLFKHTNMKSQGKKLMETLGVAVSMLDDMEKLVPVLQKLGRRHVAYGVTADMYSSVAQALLITLDKGLGDECTAETKAAWGWVLDVASKVCIDAANEFETERTE